MSQMQGPRPSSAAAPSTWYAAVAAPHTKSFGNSRGSSGSLIADAGALDAAPRAGEEPRTPPATTASDDDPASASTSRRRRKRSGLGGAAPSSVMTANRSGGSYPGQRHGSGGNPPSRRPAPAPGRARGWGGG